MRALSPLAKKKRNVIKNFISSRSRSACCGKKGLSNIVAYVLLISITISLSVLVYGWLRFYVSEDQVETCSENVNIIIRGYECFNHIGGKGGRIIVTLKNKGLFTVDGYELRVHDREDASFGVYLFDNEGEEIKPGEEITHTYWFNDSLMDIRGEKITDYELETVTLLNVQPFVTENGDIRCKSHASQEIDCG